MSFEKFTSAAYPFVVVRRPAFSQKFLFLKVILEMTKTKDEPQQFANSPQLLDNSCLS